MAILALFFGCGRGEFGDCGYTGTALNPNTEISEIIGRYAGQLSVVNADVVVAGYVTANDISGNFYRTFVIDDGTGALEVRAGLYDLKNLFPEGRYVAVKAKGLTVAEYNGVLQIGYGKYGALPEYFGHMEVLDKYVVRGPYLNIVEPLSVSIPQITRSLCGRLIMVSGLQLMAGEETIWASQSEYGTYSTRIFTDGLQNEIGVVTSKYADFAGNVIHDGEVTITGILTMERDNFLIKMRSITDVSEE